MSAPALTLAAGFALLGCGATPGEEHRVQHEPPPGLFRAQLVDGPIDGLEEVWITIESLELRKCEGDGQPWVDVPVSAEPYQMLSLQNGVQAPLSLDTWIPSGDYCELRLVVDPEGNTVKVEGQTLPLTVPSGSVMIKHDFVVANGLITEVVLDIDAQKSIEEVQKGMRYQLHPVASVADVNYTASGDELVPLGAFSGVVSFEVGPDGGSFDIGGGATVHFPPGAVENPTWFTATRWRHLSESAPSEMFRFFPAYEFSVLPEIELPHAVNQDGTFRVYVDGFSLKSFEPDGSHVTADIPHFCIYEAAQYFPDIPRDEWYTWFVNRIVCEGVMSGHADGTFRPNEFIRRAELLKILVLLVTQQSSVDAVVGPSGYQDVDMEGANQWYYKYVVWARQNGLIGETEDGDFGAGDFVTRREVAQLFVAASVLYAARSGVGGGAHEEFGDVHTNAPNGALSDAEEVFSDVPYGAAGYAEIYAMQRAGVMTGHGTTGTFGPLEYMNRAQAAKVTCIASGHCPAAGPQENDEAVRVVSNCVGEQGVHCVYVNLKDGAVLKPFLGSMPLEKDGMNIGGFACDGKRWANVFTERSVEQFTKLWTNYDGYVLQNASVMFSGTYHDDHGTPAFGIKVTEDGWAITNGYECNEAEMRMLMIENAEGRISVSAYNHDKFLDENGVPEIVVGLTENMHKSSDTGRNFVGLMNPYNGGDGVATFGTAVFLIIDSQHGRTSQQALDIFKKLNVHEASIMQFDGSTSAQLYEYQEDGWAAIVSGSRGMPQAFAVFEP